MPADYSRDELIGPLSIHHFKLGAVDIAEVELGQVA